MPSPPDQQRLTPDERANLVAYLDGELNEDDSRSIATILTKSPTARHEIAALEKTWELLDLLTLPPAPEQFSERTVTEIRRLDVEKPSWGMSLGGWGPLVARLGLAAGSAFLFYGIGFAAARWAVPDPTTRLVNDLTLAEHLDEYLQVGTFEFLSQLAESPDFPTDFR